MSHLTRKLAAGSIRHRALVVVGLVLLSALSALGYFDPNLLQLADDEDGESETPQKVGQKSESNASLARNVSPISLSNSDAVLVVESDNFFTPSAVDALRLVSQELEDLPQVRSVLWMDRVPILNIFGLPEPLLPRTTASAKRFEQAKSKAQKHPLVGGQLLSNDAKATLMLVNFDYYHVLDDADATTVLRETAEAAAAQFPETKLRFRLTGRIPSAIAALEAHESDLLKYQIIGYGMIFLMSLILFRGIRAVIIVALAPIVGVCWTLGCIRFFDYDNNPLIDVILPILVSLVGLTDGVHLTVQIRKLRAAGHDAKQAAIQGLQQVGFACFLTSLTTAIGFGSLMLADSSWVQEFGLCCMVGVILCFVAVVTVIPLASTTWLGNNIHAGHQNSLIDRNLNRIEELVGFVLKRRYLMATAAVLCTIVLAGISLTLEPDQRQTDNLPQGSEATQALLEIDRAFGGLEFSSVTVRWQDTMQSDSPEILQVVSSVDKLLQAESLIGHPLSIKNLIEAQPGSGPLAERMSLIDLLPPPLKLAFYRPHQNQASVMFRVQDLGIAKYGPVFERIESGLQEIVDAHPGFQLSLTGDAAWRWRNLYQIVVDLAASLGTASIIILIVLTAVFRSIRLGLISIIPNLFPLAFTGAYLAFAGYNLEVVMVCNFTVCLGIAVDDTIHFLTRFLEERQNTDDVDRAIRKAFTGVGTALVMTTLVLVAGFSIVTLSDAREHYIFATMGALTIAAALFCDLIFLPALLSVFAAPKPPISQSDSAEKCKAWEDKGGGVSSHLH